MVHELSDLVSDFEASLHWLQRPVVPEGLMGDCHDGDFKS